jgi:hypothetical protein
VIPAASGVDAHPIAFVRRFVRWYLVEFVDTLGFN